MSVAFASMEVAAGPTVGFKNPGPGAAAAAAASPTATYVGVREFLGRVAAAAAGEGRLPGTEGTGAAAREEGCCRLGDRRDGMGAAAPWRQDGEEDRAESSESSSIGAGEGSSLSLSSSAADDRGEGEEEVQSKLKEGALGSLEALEECLPIKRGLSNCFAGKSKSFASLSDAASLGSARELAKPENPFNKRRRILMACKPSWQRRASYASLNTSNLRALEEDEEEDDDDDGVGREGCGAGEESSPATAFSPPPPAEKKPVNSPPFRSPRSFSLSDLRHA